jgi:hypothetical protein
LLLVVVSPQSALAKKQAKQQADEEAVRAAGGPGGGEGALLDAAVFEAVGAGGDLKSPRCEFPVARLRLSRAVWLTHASAY